MNRRKVLLGGSTVAASILGFTQFTQTAEASTSISFGNLTIPNKTYYGQTPSDVILEVDAKYSYSANRVPNKWELTLEVGTTTSSYNQIGVKSRVDGLSQSSEGTDTISGSLLDAPNYDLQNDFHVSSGETKQTKVWTRLTFEVFDKDGVVGSSSVETDAVITISGEELTVDTDVGGSGGLTVKQTTA